MLKQGCHGHRRFGRKIKLPSTVAIKRQLLMMMLEDEIKAIPAEGSFNQDTSASIARLRRLGEGGSRAPESETGSQNPRPPRAPVSDPVLVGMPSEPIFTHLNARITQQDGVFNVSIRMYCSTWEQDRAWGEETASSIEIAGEMISSVALRYAIAQEKITIHLTMTNKSDGTRH